jgi:hypothetical protein
MSCADVCLSHDYDGDPSSFSVVRDVRARKPHQCCECRDAIAVGESHEVVSGKWDGDFASFRTCAACVDIRKAFVCGGWAFEYLWESMAEEMFPVWRKNGNWDCLAKLTSEAAITKCNTRYAAWLRDTEDME